MVNMPYQLEKGPIWSVVESALGEGPDAAYALLELLRDQTHEIAKGPLVKSKSLDDKKTNSTPKTRGDHLNKDWFGMVNKSGSGWVKQSDADFDPQSNPSTGFWINYWGDVEEIVRETFVRAIEVSLGLMHREVHEPYAPFARYWPISIFLKCPTPWFEGWVTWRAREADPNTHARDGSVVVHFLIPGNYGSQVLKQPGNGFNGKPNLHPDTSDAKNGMWLITHAVHTRVDGIVTTDPGTAGDIHAPAPGAILKDEGDLLVLAPIEFDGGVADDGRPYVP